MHPLWAPWRMEYILGADISEEKGCIFCNRLERKNDQKDLILHRGKRTAVFLNRFPYNNGHLMVMPLRHIAELKDLSREETLEIHKLIVLALAALKRAMNPDGFNLGINLGRVAGAGVPGHLHWHIVPRWNGDTNFMPVIGETKVMPEHLQSVYRRLRDAFAKEAHK